LKLLREKRLGLQTIIADRSPRGTIQPFNASDVGGLGARVGRVPYP